MMHALSRGKVGEDSEASGPGCRGGRRQLYAELCNVDVSRLYSFHGAVACGLEASGMLLRALASTLLAVCLRVWVTVCLQSRGCI